MLDAGSARERIQGPDVLFNERRIRRRARLCPQVTDVRAREKEEDFLSSFMRGTRSASASLFYCRLHQFRRSYPAAPAERDCCSAGQSHGDARGGWPRTQAKERKKMRLRGLKTHRTR